MVSASSEMVIVVRVVFHLLYKEMLFKKQLSQLFGQLIVGSIEKCFVCFFVFYAHSHCSVSPQV